MPSNRPGRLGIAGMHFPVTDFLFLGLLETPGHPRASRGLPCCYGKRWRDPGTSGAPGPDRAFYAGALAYEVPAGAALEVLARKVFGTPNSPDLTPTPRPDSHWTDVRFHAGPVDRPFAAHIAACEPNVEGYALHVLSATTLPHRLRLAYECRPVHLIYVEAETSPRLRWPS